MSVETKQQKYELTLSPEETAKIDKEKERFSNLSFEDKFAELDAAMPKRPEAAKPDRIHHVELSNSLGHAVLAGTLRDELRAIHRPGDSSNAA